MSGSIIVSVSRENKVALQDGEILRPLARDGNIVRGWQSGDPVELCERSEPKFHFAVTNYRTGETINMLAFSPVD
jgi:hypothetical protein